MGRAISCSEESFLTTSIVIDCGPFFDYATGQQVILGPELNFPDRLGFCKNQSVISVESYDIANGYRWYSIDSDGSETLVSTSKHVTIYNTGEYRYEAYNNITRLTSTFECTSSKTFSVAASEIAEITSIDEIKGRNFRKLEINVLGEGNYEYAIDDKEGAYQNSPIFEEVSSDYHKIFVRDKNGCGIAESSVQRNLSPDDFPKFFTPNGDNMNDFWQLKTPETANEIIIQRIYIFNRLGTLLAVIDSESNGWDGTFNGQDLPSSDYWFRAVALNQDEVKGHFTLKR